MGIDIRILLGFMFTAYGCILAVFGWLSDQSVYERSLGININLLWGVVLIVFGVLMLACGRLRLVTHRPVSQEIPDTTAVSVDHK
jgi:multisubunit Na+/H+ antiporter MnhG subunit